MEQTDRKLLVIAYLKMYIVKNRANLKQILFSSYIFDKLCNFTEKKPTKGFTHMVASKTD